jgi:hypothetical protein
MLKETARMIKNPLQIFLNAAPKPISVKKFPNHPTKSAPISGPITLKRLLLENNVPT